MKRLFITLLLSNSLNAMENTRDIEPLTLGNLHSSKIEAKIEAKNDECFLLKKDTAGNIIKVDNPKAPLFFLLKDQAGQVSYLLLTCHNLPLKSLKNEKVIRQAFTEWTNLHVVESLHEDPWITIKNLDGLASGAEKRLEGKYISGLPEKYSAVASILKPWVIYALKQLQEVQSVSESMDLELMEASYEKGKKIQGLETQTELVEKMGLNKLTYEKVVELLEKEAEKINKSSAIIEEGPVTKAYKEGDLLALTTLIREAVQLRTEDDFLNSSLQPRNELWKSRIIDYHNKNKGEVFYSFGAAHGVTEIGLLQTLQDHFKILRLDEDGTFRSFTYKTI